MKVSEIPGITKMDAVRIYIGGDLIDRRLSEDPWILDIDIRNSDWEYDAPALLLRIWT